MSSEEPSQIQPERLTPLENELKTLVNPAVGHLLYSTIDSSYLYPEEKGISTENFEKVKSKKPEELPYLLADKVSWDSRNKANDGTEFDIRNKNWNEKFWNEVKILARDGEDLNLNHIRANAFDALGLNVMDDTKNGDLFYQAETFRAKYCDKSTSNIKGFIEDIANKCLSGDGSIDIKKLTETITAIEPLLGIYGSDININLLIKDYATAYGILSQPQEIKNQFVEEATIKIGQPVDSPSKNYLQLLFDKKDFYSSQNDTSTSQNQDPPASPENNSTQLELTPDQLILVNNIEESLQRPLRADEIIEISNGKSGEEVIEFIKNRLEAERNQILTNLENDKSGHKLDDSMLLSSIQEISLLLGWNEQNFYQHIKQYETFHTILKQGEIPTFILKFTKGSKDPELSVGTLLYNSDQAELKDQLLKRLQELNHISKPDQSEPTEEESQIAEPEKPKTDQSVQIDGNDSTPPTEPIIDVSNTPPETPAGGATPIDLPPQDPGNAPDSNTTGKV